MTKKPRKPPTDITYDKTTGDKVCEYLAQGLSLRKIHEIEGMPSPCTVVKWRNTIESFEKQYIRAREEQADFYADEIITIVDTCEDPVKARLMMDARKWVAAKLRPKSWGDKIDVEHTGQVVVMPVAMIDGQAAQYAIGSNKVIEGEIIHTES